MTPPADPVVELRLTYACGCRVRLVDTWTDAAYTSLCAIHNAPVRISCELRWRRVDERQPERLPVDEMIKERK